MTGKDFLAQAAGTMAANHLREIAEWIDKYAELEAENADLKAKLSEAEKRAGSTATQSEKHSPQ